MRIDTIYSDELNGYVNLYWYNGFHLGVSEDYQYATNFKNWLFLKYLFIWRANKKFNYKFRIKKFEFLTWHIQDNLDWNVNNWWKNILLIFAEIKHELEKQLEKESKNDKTN